MFDFILCFKVVTTVFECHIVSEQRFVMERIRPLSLVRSHLWKNKA